MSQTLNCLRCKQTIDANYDQCPHCGEKVTLFQKTYSTRLLDGKYQIIDRLGVGGMGEIFKVGTFLWNSFGVLKFIRRNFAAAVQDWHRSFREPASPTWFKKPTPPALSNAKTRSTTGSAEWVMGKTSRSATSI